MAAPPAELCVLSPSTASQEILREKRYVVQWEQAGAAFHIFLIFWKKTNG